MMTFEVSILCEGYACEGKNKATGDPSDKVEDAIENAKSEAVANHWLYEYGRWKCPKCQDAGPPF